MLTDKQRIIIRKIRQDPITFFTINPAEHPLDFYSLCVDTACEVMEEDVTKAAAKATSLAPAEAAEFERFKIAMYGKLEKIKTLQQGIGSYTQFFNLSKAVTKFKNVTKEDTATYNRYVKAQLAVWQYCDSLTPQQVSCIEQVLADPKHRELTMAYINMYKELAKTGVEQDDEQKIICQKYDIIFDAIEDKYATSGSESGSAPTRG